MRILVIDDDLWLLTGLRRALRMDYDVKIADDGELAVNIAGRFRPDVVLVDLFLRWHNGLDVVERLRSMLPDADIIMMTSYPEDNQLSDEAFASGANWYLRKGELALLFSVLDQISAARGFREETPG